MTVLSSEKSSDFAQRGDAIYESKRPEIELSQAGKVVAIDIITEAFAVGDSALEASDRLRTLHPEAQVWLTRVGSRYLRRMRGSQGAK